MSDRAKRVPKARDTYVSLHGLGVKRFVAMPVRGALGHKIDLRQGFQTDKVQKEDIEALFPGHAELFDPVVALVLGVCEIIYPKVISIFISSISWNLVKLAFTLKSSEIELFNVISSMVK